MKTKHFIAGLAGIIGLILFFSMESYGKQVEWGKDREGRLYYRYCYPSGCTSWKLHSSNYSKTKQKTRQNTSSANIDRAEAQKAFQYLNSVRRQPSKYSREIGANLSSVSPRNSLRWNNILAKVAEEKAYDMAKRGYYGHVTPEGLGINIQIHNAGYTLPSWMLRSKSENTFESIAYGQSTGISAIKNLILDNQASSYLHRSHLLGISDFWSGCTDIGIGFVKAPSSKYGTYCCVIIARRN